ncbi:hypothetical protein N7481_013194 [Penicillium waksmanii]|uniref:uncharacterized protein n=1 Tax=Penicillium waksmanii TaxID=69791 RepID=UPI002548C5D9|nr:uncharacterized protein N7481_013194 [Penicillium waksmanii]KAJ5966480.1 hypothetical protein N7481_013194 [Penicillium waksmanii]
MFDRVHGRISVSNFEGSIGLGRQMEDRPSAIKVTDKQLQMISRVPRVFGDLTNVTLAVSSGGSVQFGVKIVLM